MNRTSIFALVVAAATAAPAPAETGRQRFQAYGRLVAANPSASTVMVERIDGTLWVYRVDGTAARELSALRAGQEVALTFIYDGPGRDDADVVRDFEILAPTVDTVSAMPFGVVAGTSVTEAGYVRTAGGAWGIGAQRLDTTGGLLPGLGVPGPVLLPVGSGVRSGGVVSGGGLVAAATTADTLRVVGLASDTSGRPQAAGNFTPGNTAPNVRNPGATGPSTAGTLARPAAQSGFTPGTRAPGVRDLSVGRETLTPGVPANLVIPNNAATGTGTPVQGGGTPTATGGPAAAAQTGTGGTSPAANVPPGMTQPPGTTGTTGSTGRTGTTGATGTTTGTAPTRAPADPASGSRTGTPSQPTGTPGSVGGTPSSGSTSGGGPGN